MSDFLQKYPDFHDIDLCPFDVINNNCHYYKFRNICLSITMAGGNVIVMNSNGDIAKSIGYWAAINAARIEKQSRHIGYQDELQIFLDEFDNVFDIRSKDGFMSFNLMNSIYSDIVPVAKPDFSGSVSAGISEDLPSGVWIIKPAISVTDDQGIPIYVKATTEQIKHRKDTEITKG